MKWFGNEGECDTLDVLMVTATVHKDHDGKWMATANISTKGSATGLAGSTIHQKKFSPCDTDTEARARVDKWIEACAAAMLRKV